MDTLRLLVDSREEEAAATGRSQGHMLLPPSRKFKIPILDLQGRDEQESLAGPSGRFLIIEVISLPALSKS